MIPALPQRIPETPVAALYQVWLGGVVGLLLLLQVLYLALVLLFVGAAVGWVLYVAPVVLSKLAWYTILLAVGVPVALGVAAFFLFKPFLLRYPKPKPVLALQREEEPRLFAFVEGLADAMGAPRPSAIEVDLEVNASASLRSGWRSLFSRDLTLRLGLPLVAGLPLDRMAGIIAHEYGHFTQAWAMRLTFLMWKQLHWFARVVHERDAWDARLEGWREAAGWRTVWIVWVAMGAVWLGRTVLRGMLWAGQFASASLSRQMEYHADSYEVKLVGRRGFAENFKDLDRMGCSAEQAWGMLDRHYQRGTLTANIPRLIAMRREALGSETLRELEVMTLTRERDALATHPTPAERIAAAGWAPEQGLYVCARPAGVLFRDFEALCERAGQYHLDEIAELGVETARRVPVEEFAGRGLRQEAAMREVERRFGENYQPHGWLRFPEGEGEASGARLEGSVDGAFDELEQLQLRDYGTLALWRTGASVEFADTSLLPGDFEASVAKVERRFGELEELAVETSRKAWPLLRWLRGREGWAEYERGQRLMPELFRLRLAVVALQDLQRNAGLLPEEARRREEEVEQGRARRAMEKFAAWGVELDEGVPFVVGAKRFYAEVLFRLDVQLGEMCAGD